MALRKKQFKNGDRVIIKGLQKSLNGKPGMVINDYPEMAKDKDFRYQIVLRNIEADDWSGKIVYIQEKNLERS